MYVFLDYDVLERKFEVSYYFHYESQAREMFYERRKPYRLVLNVPDKYYDCWDWLNEHSIPNPFAFDELIEKGVYVVLYYVNDKQKECFRAACYKSKEYVKYLAYEPVRRFKPSCWKFFPEREETHFFYKIIMKIPANYKEALAWAENHNFSYTFEKQLYPLNAKSKSYIGKKWKQIKCYLQRLFLKLKHLITQQ